MQRRLGSLASSLNKQVQQLSKGAQQIAYNIVLLQEEQARMRSAIKELTKRKTYKRQYV
jgi:outer membrane murein-binding lipoprotein Lpp